MLQRLAFSAARQAKAIGSALRDATHTHRAFSTQLDFVDIDQSTRGDEVREFVAEPRVVDGSRACAELRKQGYVPGIVYGKDAAGQDRRLLVQLPQNQLQRELNDVGRAIENTIYKIKVADEEFSVIPRNLQRHPTKDMPNSVNFLCHDPSRKLKVQIPLEFFNVEKCTGLRQGGRLEIAQRDLFCYVKGRDTIPRNIRINLAGYSIGERVRVEHMEYPEGIVPLRPKEMIFKITGRRGVKA